MKAGLPRINAWQKDMEQQQTVNATKPSTGEKDTLFMFCFSRF
jgi:hypothetical protein